MKVVTSQEMREIDRAAIEDYGIPSAVLMERAGLAVARRVANLYPDKRIVVLCGSGNNGGDGIVAARNLYNWGFKVNILILSKKKSLSQDCNMQYQIAKKMKIPIEFRISVNERDIHGVVVLDAVFGTGLNRPVPGDISKIFDLINASGVSVLSVDMPSGISSDTGEIYGTAIMADSTVTFGLPKRGHLLYPGAEYTGRLFVEDIGFPTGLITSNKLKVNLISPEMISVLLPQRRAYSHKGDYGHVLIIAGSRGKTGAALMAAKACLRSGAGLVTLAVPESLMNVFQNRVTEEMTLPLQDDGSGIISVKAAEEILRFSHKVDVIAIGSGMGVSSDTGMLMKELVERSPVPMVIDADGINSLRSAQILKKAKSPIILTPHLGEMAGLIQRTEDIRHKTEEKKLRGMIEKDRINTAMSFSKGTGAYLVLKGAPTIIAEPEGKAFLNTTGNPGMATAGSGDVLTGIVASLIGQGLNPLNASLLGTYLHGCAGDMAAKNKGEYSLIATDIIDFIPDAILGMAVVPHPC
ncbi:MAG: NAD(P)H-hydrate dehydratase [Thermodesulfovibrionales bacterium]|nr:NAD(P)H-hydrate dehydratase [Thermodesulfovibrionales bacterium]